MSQRSQDESGDKPADIVVARWLPTEGAEPAAPIDAAPPAMVFNQAAAANDFSAMQRFAEARGIAYGLQAQDVVNEFEALPDDAAWAYPMEALLSIRAWRLTSRYDTLVTLVSFHRRCGPEWKCLE